MSGLMAREVIDSIARAGAKLLSDKEAEKGGQGSGGGAAGGPDNAADAGGGQPVGGPPPGDNQGLSTDGNHARGEQQHPGEG